MFPQSPAQADGSPLVIGEQKGGFAEEKVSMQCCPAVAGAGEG